MLRRAQGVQSRSPTTEIVGKYYRLCTAVGAPWLLEQYRFRGLGFRVLGVLVMGAVG